MRAGLVLVMVLAACGGPDGGSTLPGGRPAVQLVRCLPAPAPPQADAGLDLGGLRGIDDGVLGQRRRAIEEARRAGVLGPGGWGTGSRGPGGKSVELKRVGTAPAVTLGRPTTTGPLDGTRVAAVMRGKLAELTSCLEADIATGSPLQRAVVSWRLTIDSSGRVTQANETARVLGQALTSCVTLVIRSAAFPPSVGDPVTVSLPLVFDAAGAPAKPMPDNDGPTPWTPFARAGGDDPWAAAAASSGRAAEGAVRRRLAAIGECFKDRAPTGSLRALLAIDPAGELTGLRVGGLGDQPTEGCVARALGGLRVLTPLPEPAEIACDLARGDAQPWRMTPAAGYGVIEASRARVRYGTRTLARGSPDAEPLDDGKLYLVIAEPDAPGSMILLAFGWANDQQGGGALLAVRDGARPPLFAGFGQTGVHVSLGEPEAVRPALRIDARSVTACMNRASQQAQLAEASAVGALVQRLAAKCRSLSCAPTLMIELDPDAVARDVIEVVGAARRAGFDRVMIGGDAGCAPAGGG